jgi:hypothetical protein
MSRDPGTDAFIASTTREEWIAAYEKLRPMMNGERFTVHFGGPVLPPPGAGPRWKPEGFTVWVGDKYARGKTLGVAVDRAIRKYKGEPDED